MRMFFSLLITLIFLFACTEDTGTNGSSSENDPKNLIVGWRPAGFVPQTDFSQGGGLQRVTHSKNWLVLMDSWTSPIEGKPGYITYSPRLFVSKIGTDVWDTIVPPTSTYVKSLYADSTGIYVGTHISEVVVYYPDTKKWEKINIKEPNDTLEYKIYGITKFKGKLMISMVGYHEDLGGYYGKILLEKDSGWQELPTPIINTWWGAAPLYFVEGVEIEGNFYIGTTNGVWKLEGATLSWTQLPQFPKIQWLAPPDTFREVYGLVNYKGNLVVLDGRCDAVYQWDETEKWMRLDSMLLPLIDENNHYLIYSNTTSEPNDITTDGKYLFITGDTPEIPFVYMGDYGEPYGNIYKGWRRITHGWCSLGGCHRTPSIDIVGDTLYAAEWSALYKFPLSELDIAIADEPDFKNFDQYEEDELLPQSTD